ncbi:PDZ/DHR/GLGF domain protein, partial [Cooperia oncophora]
MVSNSDKSPIVNERPIDHAGESLLRGLENVDKKPKEELDSILGTGYDTSKFADDNSGAKCTRTAISPYSTIDTRLGFNIVGGKDSQHIPGHNGIFVSIIKSDGPAYIDGRLSVGDLILSINGVDLVNKTHDEAVSIFRSQNQSTVDLLVEIGAENRILN